MTELYPNFKPRWERSQKGVRTIAEYLWKRGETVFIGYQELAKTLEEALDFVDDGDMFVHRNSKDLRVEVKWLEKTDFTGGEDFPHPEFIVCETASYKKADPEPDFYIIMENLERAIAIIDVKETKKYWYWKWLQDGSRKKYGKRQYWICTLDHVKWIKF